MYYFFKKESHFNDRYVSILETKNLNDSKFSDFINKQFFIYI